MRVNGTTRWIAVVFAVSIFGMSSIVAGMLWRGSAPSAGPPRIPTLVAPYPAQALLGMGVSDVSLFVEPDDGKLKLTRPIRMATHSIDLTMYMLTDHTLIHDLEYAAASGIRVRVILERAPYGSDVSTASINHSAYDQLYAANIPVHWSSTRFALTHEKTMIVDATAAYILTMNYTRSAFTKNREFGMIDRTPTDVREAEAVFNADWADIAYLPHDPNLLVSPVNSRTRLLALLARARKHVEIYTEELQDTGIEDALLAVVRRGVSVRLITNPSTGALSIALAQLRTGGIRVMQIGVPYIHAKMVMVDDRWAFIGSENFSAASLDRNRELGVLVSDPVVLSRLAAIFAQDWAA